MNIYSLLTKKVSFRCSANELSVLMAAIKMLAVKREPERPNGIDLLVLATHLKTYRYLSNRLQILYMQGKTSGTLSFSLTDLLILHGSLVEDYDVPELRLVLGKIDKIAVDHSHLVNLTQSTE